MTKGAGFWPNLGSALGGERQHGMNLTPGGVVTDGDLGPDDGSALVRQT
jgi:hypothetical protein